MNCVASIAVKITHLYYWYRESTKEWCVFLNYNTNNTSCSIVFPNKKLNKAKKNLIKYLSEGFCGEELVYLIKTGKLTIKGVDFRYQEDKNGQK